MTKPKSALVQLAEVKRVLANGGLVRFIWASGHTVLISANGKRLTMLDGRAYHAFLKTVAPSLQETMLCFTNLGSVRFPVGPSIR